MADDNFINRQKFDALLSWLDGNRETAAEKYEKIRGRLIRIFVGRGCFEAELLADETFDRVARKLPEIAKEYTGDPAIYFYGVARRIFLEWQRRQQRLQEIQLPEIDGGGEKETDSAIKHQCLEDCLKKLSADRHQLIVAYHQAKKGIEKIETRRRLAESLGITQNALHVKASRIRARLLKCLRKCIAEKI